MFNSPSIRAALLALISSTLAASALSQNFLTDIPAGSRGMVSGPEIGARLRKARLDRLAQAQG